MKIIPSEEFLRKSLRFHLPHYHLSAVFGSDWFGLKAEKFARFFGTPAFLGLQTLVVIAWVIVNLMNLVKFDPYPFILLNLFFSLQSAYAAPMILLAQTRQADRDKAISEADACHREELAKESASRQTMELQHSEQILSLLDINTQLTQTVHELSLKIEQLTKEIHEKLQK